MSPGMWHWSCCCGGGGSGIGYLFARGVTAGKPVVVAISDAGAFAYELIDPTDWGSAVTQTYTPCAATSGLIAFAYLDTSGYVRLGLKVVGDPAWQYYAGPEEIGGVDMDIAGEMRFYSNLGFAPDDTMYMSLERTGYDVYTSLKNVGTQDWDELSLVHNNPGWCVNGSTGDPWITYNQTRAWPETERDIKFEKESAAAEVAESYSSDYELSNVVACSTTDGRIWAPFSVTKAAAPRTISMRLAIRGAAGGYTFVDLPLPAGTYYNTGARACRSTSDAVMVLGWAQITGTTTYDVLLWVIDPSTLVVTTHTIVSAATTLGVIDITTTDSGVPCVAKGPNARTEQMRFYLQDGATWTEYTTAYAGGFELYIRTAWNSYV